MAKTSDPSEDVTVRVTSSSDVLDRILPHQHKIGVTRLADLTGLDCIGIPVWAAHRPNARSLAVTQGKGTTIKDARVSALMEAVELSCAETPNLPLRLTTASALSAETQVIDLHDLPISQGRAVPMERKALWVEGKTLDSEQPVWVPYELVHMDYTLPLPPRLGCFLMSSTGLASGSSLPEAAAQAIAETLERDAVTLWHQQPNRCANCRVDPDSVDDPACADLLRRFAVANVACAIWDVTSDLGIPAFFVTIIDRQDDTRRGLHAASGSGCHPKRGVALKRALTEAAQSRLTLISGARDDRSRSFYQSMRDAETLTAQRNNIIQGALHLRFDDVVTHPVETLDQSLSCMMAAIRQAGLGEPVAVDLSAPHIPASVVRILVPGLEGTSDAPGYTPGRRAKALAG